MRTWARVAVFVVSGVVLLGTGFLGAQGEETTKMNEAERGRGGGPVMLEGLLEGIGVAGLLVVLGSAWLLLTRGSAPSAERRASAAIELAEELPVNHAPAGNQSPPSAVVAAILPRSQHIDLVVLGGRS